MEPERPTEYLNGVGIDGSDRARYQAVADSLEVGEE
jgi:hypothetical protein